MGGEGGGSFPRGGCSHSLSLMQCWAGSVVPQQMVRGQRTKLWGRSCWCPQLPWAGALPQPWTVTLTCTCMHLFGSLSIYIELLWFMCFLLSYFPPVLVLCAAPSNIHQCQAAWRRFCSLVPRICYTNINPWVSSSLVCTIPTSPVATLISHFIFPYFPAESCSRPVRPWEGMEVT